jgi:hypothetical protein
MREKKCEIPKVDVVVELFLFKPIQKCFAEFQRTNNKNYYNNKDVIKLTAM